MEINLMVEQKVCNFRSVYRVAQLLFVFVLFFSTTFLSVASASTYGAGTYGGGAYSAGDFQTSISQESSVSSVPTVISGSGGGTIYGCKDPNATNYNYFSASNPALCRYATGSSVNNMVVSTSTSTSVLSFFSRNLELGITGKDVLVLQEFLVTQNIGVAALKLKKNGYTNFFGPLTQSALIEFQKANGIKPSVGYFGPVTRAYVASHK